MFALPTYILV